MLFKDVNFGQLSCLYQCPQSVPFSLSIKESPHCITQLERKPHTATALLSPKYDLYKIYLKHKVPLLVIHGH